jgi:SAM-dependent methyltransferase
MPIDDNLIDIYQSEDVFEHLPYDSLPSIFNEIFRVLKPGGLFRLSVPDYRSPVYSQRSLRDASGAIVFDPGGGGRYVAGKVVDGGHLWFPIIETVKQLFATTAFGGGGVVRYLHYFDPAGSAMTERIDYSLGHIQRTPDHDPRTRAPRQPLSIVVDAVKSRTDR